MKKLALMAMAALAMVACQNKENAYTITGTIEGAADNDSITLSLIEGRKLVDLQKSPIVGGKFEIKGVADSVQIAHIGLGRVSCLLFLEPGDIKVDLKLSEVSSAIGTPNNNAFEAFTSDINALEEEYAAIVERAQDPELTDGQREELRAQMSSFEEKYYQAIKNSITDNAGTEFGLYNLRNYYTMYDPEELSPILESYVAAFPTDAYLLQIKKQNDITLETAPGMPYKDFEMADTEGNMHKLSEYIAANKVTLIDFWASWCGPCKREMPNVIAAYKAYSKKGFGIVGVSLDENETAWKEAIKTWGMTWPQMSDLKGWACEGSKLYGVNAIPATVLVDQEGTIIARNLRGEAIQEKLSELLK